MFTSYSVYRTQRLDRRAQRHQRESRNQKENDLEYIRFDRADGRLIGGIHVEACPAADSASQLEPWAAALNLTNIAFPHGKHFSEVATADLLRRDCPRLIQVSYCGLTLVICLECACAAESLGKTTPADHSARADPFQSTYQICSADLGVEAMARPCNARIRASRPCASVSASSRERSSSVRLK